MRRFRPLLPTLLLLGHAAVPGALAQDGVTIYRCTDAQGRLALQDFPCAHGEAEEVRTMLRPQDPPPRPAPAVPAAAAAPAAAGALPAEPQIVIRGPPRPMYECTTPDGERYTSDSGDGNPRPAPAWNWGDPWAGPAPGMSPRPHARADRRAAGIASPGMSTSPGPSLTSPSRGPAPVPPPGHRPPPVHGYAMGGGWIRDTCHPLPQSRVCSLLGDRRTEIRRRMFNAQPSERAVLRDEERGISARLNDDCGLR